MTTIQTTPAADTLVVTPTTSASAPQPTATTSRRRTSIVAASIAALALAGIAGAAAYRAQDPAQPAATVPAVVGSLEDDSAVLHGGAGLLATVDGLPVQTTGSSSTTGTGSNGTPDPSIAHGAGDDVVTITGRVHG